MTASDRERIQGLLAEGWRRLESGEPREAALVFGRVALVEPTRAEAVRGLAAANAAITESQRQADERLEQARQALERGDHAAWTRAADGSTARTAPARPRRRRRRSPLPARAGRDARSPPAGPPRS